MTGNAGWQTEARRVARGIRRRVLTHVLEHSGGYLSQACSSAEILATLYCRVMCLGPSQGPKIPPPFSGVPSSSNPESFCGALYNGPQAPELDRFFFSPVHYSLALYAALIEVGRLAPEALDHFNQDGSTVEMIGAEHSPGIETMAGSLGQTLSQAGGVALARRLNRESGRVWVFMSDGEFQEGQTWEALAAARHHGLSNLGVFVDVNGQQCDGPTVEVMNTEPLAVRVSAFGAKVREVDGHDVAAIAEPAGQPWRGSGQMLVVLCRTDPCREIDLLRQRAPKLHYVRFQDDEERHSYRDLRDSWDGSASPTADRTAASPTADRTEVASPTPTVDRTEVASPTPAADRTEVASPSSPVHLVRRPHRRNLVRWAADRTEVVVLSADLTSSCEADAFRQAFPERFFSLGMAEQNMMGFAAGLAREGFTPFVHTFAVFIVRRPYDQVAMSIAYPNLPVRLLGFVPGVTTPGGVSHQAIDDLALMRALPNMTVLECGDATDVESVLDVAQSVQGPVYVRMLRGEVPRLFDSVQDPLLLNRARVLSEGTDLALLTSGICTAEAGRITPQIQRKGVEIQHLHVSTLKPFSDPAVLDAMSTVKLGVITLENHSVIGGLGSATAELLTQVDFGRHRRLVRLGLSDTFAHGASRTYLMREYGIDAMALLHAVEQLVGGSLGLTEEALLPNAMLGCVGSGSVEDL